LDAVDSFLRDVAAERSGCNHSGKRANLDYRLNRLLEGRLVLADRLICRTMEF
jgi:hypothetical protein